ncbi:MAG: hypothetical protein ABIJ14_03815 [Nanoarchaeota archaeon]|nr:hypothetical protein [Nanoarchaeota archaeon]
MTNGLYNNKQIAEMLFSIYGCMVARHYFLEKRNSMNLQPFDDRAKETKEWEIYIEKVKKWKGKSLNQ